MQNKTVLITGSSGFLGSHSAEFLKSQGHTVHGIDTVPGKYTTIIANCLTDLPDKDYDVLLHYAAEVKGRLNIEHGYLSMAKNIEIDRVTFIWAIAHCKQIVYPSSCAVYPIKYQTEVNTPLSEDLIDFTNNNIGVSDHIYGWSKLTAERLLWEISKSNKIKIAILRPFSVYGAKQTSDYPIPALIQKIKKNPDIIEVWGSGQQTRDWVHINDFVSTLNWCINNPALFFILNVGTGIQTSFVQLINKIHNAIYGKTPYKIAPLLDKPQGCLHRLSDTKLQRSLNLLPTVTLDMGIRELV